jgi:hypothetical protein
MQPSQPAQSPGPQDNAAAIRGLLQGFNIPPNVMEQISGMFGGHQKPAQGTLDDQFRYDSNGARQMDKKRPPAPPPGQAQPQPAEVTLYDPRFDPPGGARQQMKKPWSPRPGPSAPQEEQPKTLDQINSEYAQLSPLIQSLASARGVGSSGRTGGLSGAEAYRAHQDWRQTRMRTGQDPGPEKSYEQVMQELDRARGLQTRATELQEEQRPLRKSQGATRSKADIAPSAGRNSIESIAADPNLTPSEKANKFMAASKESLDNQTFKHSDIDLLGLSPREAQLLKNRASLHQRSVGNFQRAREASAMFPNYGLKQQDYAAAARKYGLT